MLFIVGGFILSISVGLFFAILIAGCFPDMKIRKKILFMIIFSLIIGFGASLLFCNQAETENELWNNGMCPTCQKHWEFTNTAGNYERERYCYICPKCKDLIELSEYKK